MKLDKFRSLRGMTFEDKDLVDLINFCIDLCQMKSGVSLMTIQKMIDELEEFKKQASQMAQIGQSI
mgnify:FL=1